MKDRLRVVHVIDGLGFGGAEMLLAELASGAEAAGIDLAVGYLRDKDGNPAGARLRSLGIEPVHLPIDGLLSRSSFRSVRAGLETLGADVVHTHLGYSDLLAGAAARRLGLPAFSTLHVMEWERDMRNRTKLRLFAAARRRWDVRVVAVSAAGRAAYLAERWDRPERVVVLHNGVSDRARPGSGPAVRRELGLGPDDFVLAMVTVLRPGKGHDIAIDATARLRRGHPEVRLLIVGDGPSRREIEARAEEGVVFAGHRDDVMSVLDAVDVLIHPSRVDAFPTALLEAMCAGVPVVATAVGGIPEIVVPGETGMLVPAPPAAPGLVAAVEAVLRGPERRTAMAAAARRRYEEHFTADGWARRLREMYDDALAGRRRTKEANDR